MSWQRWWLAAGFAAAMVTSVSAANADGASSCSSITRANLVPCVMRASLGRRAGVAGIEAAEGRVAATEPWFPAGPAVSLTGARRDGAEGKAFNWSASHGVEIEVAGQRGARRGAALAEKEAETKNVEALGRSSAALAWRTYFDVLAAEEALRLAERLEAVSRRVWDAARAAAERGALPGVEADLAEAQYVRVTQRRIEAQREERTSRSELAALLGRESDQNMDVHGALDPLSEAERVDKAHAVEPPEAAALEAEGRAFSARATSWRRDRVPSPTLSVFAENDGFNEKVLGVGLAFPLPLPEPIGRMHAGEITENEALARRAALLAADSRRSAKAELAAAIASYEAARESTRTYTKERVERAEATLASLAAAVEAGRIGTRDAVILQEPLFDLLFGAVEARRLLCVASANVARAAGVRLEDGGVR